MNINPTHPICALILQHWLPFKVLKSTIYIYTYRLDIDIYLYLDTNIYIYLSIFTCTYLYVYINYLDLVWPVHVL